MLHKSKFAVMLFLASFLLIFTNASSAHCDTMEGPVVKASQKALLTGNFNYVLIWIQPKYEQEIKNLFEKVLRVRKLNNEAKELADMYFFETVVRLHRMGEGEPYTGIEPAGYKPEKGIEAADAAIEKGSIGEILSYVDKSKQSGIIKYFDEVEKNKNYDINDVDAGREYVKAYVHFIHYVESLFNSNKTEHDHKNHN